MSERTCNDCFYKFIMFAASIEQYYIFSKTTMKMTPHLNISQRLLTLGHPMVMGILNITPDSFYDGGKYTTEQAMLARAEQILNEGGDIIDVGAVSTRPGAIVCDEATELKAIEKAVQSIRAQFPEAVISVDTFRAAVARAAVQAGADIINDVSGGTFDEAMIPTIGELQVPYVLMHTPAMPDKMQQCTHYDDILADMLQYFGRQLEKLRDVYVHDIIIDPGFGFGKTVEQNYYLLDNLRVFKQFGFPLLIGISRKSMIYKPLNTTPENALEGTLAATKVALQNGADILRVHDVAATKALL